MAKKEAKSNKENFKNKKHFLKDFKAELKKVIWPTPKQLLIIHSSCSYCANYSNNCFCIRCSI